MSIQLALFLLAVPLSAPLAVLVTKSVNREPSAEVVVFNAVWGAMIAICAIVLQATR